MKKIKDIYKHLKGDNLKKLEREGIRQQRFVNNMDQDLDWIQKKLTYRKEYANAKEDLARLDAQYSGEKRKLFRDRVLAGGAVGGTGYAAYEGNKNLNRTKTASNSRLMNLLKGTKHKALKKEVETAENLMRRAEKNPFVNDDTFKVLNEDINSLRKEKFREGAKRVGTYTGLASLPVLGTVAAKKSKEKKPLPNHRNRVFVEKRAALTKEKAFALLTALGGGIGAGVTALDKDVENNLKNIGQGAAVGGGISGALSGSALLIAKSPKLQMIFEKLAK